MDRINFGIDGPVIGDKQAVQFVQLGPKSGQWLDIAGAHVAYAPVEHIEYFPTVAEQRFKQGQPNSEW